MAGATVVEDCPVERIVVGAESGVVEGVQTKEGLLRAGKVILCAGSWSRGTVQYTLKHSQKRFVSESYISLHMVYPFQMELLAGLLQGVN